MSSKSSKKVNKTSYDRLRKNRPVDIVNTVYLVFITTVYTLYMHNMYFDITGTRAKTFTYGSLFYVLLIVLAYGLEIVLAKYYDDEVPLFYKDTKIWGMPEVWIVLFLFANIFAWMMSDNKIGSWDGSSGRFMGLSLILVASLMMMFLCKEACPNPVVFMTLYGSSTFAFMLACIQHFGADPMGLKEKVVDRQKEMFISTFGNINTYGSYLCIALPIFLAVFIFSKKMWARAISAIVIIEASMGIIPAKSDNVYLGLGAAFVLLLYIAIYNKRFTEYLFSVALVILGLFAMAMLNTALKGSQKHINGVAKLLENPKVMGVLLVAVIIILVASMLYRSIRYESYKAIQGKKLLIGITAVMVVGFLVVFAWGVKTKNEIFVFNDEWGTYRGYIWTRGVSLYKDADPMQKLFGYGNETIGSLMNSPKYYDEMIEITGRKYDNLHNELLQYLVTTGLFGLISYLGLAISSFVYIGKRMKDDAIAIACLVSGVAYLAQCIVTLNQPITSPFFFVVLASGIGYVRYKAQGFGDYKADDK